MLSPSTRRTPLKSTSAAKDPSLAAHNRRRVQALRAEDAVVREHSQRLRAAQHLSRPPAAARVSPPRGTPRAALSAASPASPAPAAGRGRKDESPVPPVPLALCSLVPPQRARHADAGKAAAEPAANTQGDEEAAQRVAFAINGPYRHVVFVQSSAALWAANGETGEIDIFSAVSGEILAHIPARSPAGHTPGGVVVPTALHAAQHHVWAGYSDGSVAVYDHLCVTPLTAGRFHTTFVVAICTMADGTVVSGSIDMVFVRWDKEVKCFEAITRITGVSEAHQSLSCIEPFGSKIILCGSRAGSILLVNCESGLQVASLRGHSGRVHALVVLNDLLFSSAEDKVVNVWSMPDDAEMNPESMQRSCKLLKRIPVQVIVRDMIPHAGSHSLWVAYTDGLVERWSANPDDDFGVEQVVREAFGDASDSSLERLAVLGLHSLGTVETMRVLAIGSNGVSKVWLSHRNVVEESLEDSIAAMRAVISKDTEEAVVWRQKALAVKQRELKRKDSYCSILRLYHVRQLLFSYYGKWQRCLAAHRLCDRQHEEICLHLEARYEFRLCRRYFTLWCRFYDTEQWRFRRQLMAVALERVSVRAWEAQILSRWRHAVATRRIRRRQRAAMQTLSTVTLNAVRAQYFSTWFSALRRFAAASPLAVQLSERTEQLAARAQRRLLRSAYDCWRRTRALRSSDLSRSFLPATRSAPLSSGDSPAPLFFASASSSSSVFHFAAAYAGVNAERWRRRLFARWRRWHERRRILHALRALAAATARQRSRALQFRALVAWFLLLQRRRLVRLEESVHTVETQLRDAEEAHTDIFDKLQLQKRLDQLRRQHEQEMRDLQEAHKRAAQLAEERSATRGTSTPYGSVIDLSAECNNTLNNNNNTIVTNSNNNSNTSYHTINSSQHEEKSAAQLALFSPATLSRLPTTEAAAFVMTRLKGAVLNMYTDMALFRQICDRMRCGTTAAVIFLEGFNEVKRVVVTVSKTSVSGLLRAGERWRLTAEMIDSMPQHQCATAVQALKAMVVAHDMVSAADGESVALTREEIVANADLLFLLWRACYAARKPQLPVNNRVPARNS